MDPAAPQETALGRAGQATGASGQGPEPRPPGPVDLSLAVETYESPLLRYVRQLVGPGDAEDLVQETFLRLHRYVERRGGAAVRNLSSWLFRVAHNLALDSRRRRRVRDRAEERALRLLVPEKEQGPEGLAALVRRAACERAVEELGRLPDRQRHCLLLKVIQDMSFREIALVTGMTVGNVAYHINHALQELARRLRAAGVI
jgi:RNA polymerase sigma-70 factor (ECF subfamily)